MPLDMGSVHPIVDATQPLTFDPWHTTPLWESWRTWMVRWWFGSLIKGEEEYDKRHILSRARKKARSKREGHTCCLVSSIVIGSSYPERLYTNNRYDKFYIISNKSYPITRGHFVTCVFCRHSNKKHVRHVWFSENLKENMREWK